MRARGLVLATTLLLTGLASALAVRAADRIECRWSIDSERGGKLNLHMERRAPHEHTSWSTDMAAAELKGLDARSLAGPRTPVQFELARESGRAVYHGSASNGRASGTFDWVPDAAFRRDLERRLGENVSDVSLFSAWISNLTRDDVHQAGEVLAGRLTLEDLQNLKVHGGRAERLHALHEAGLGEIGSTELSTLLIHGIRPEEVAALRTLRNRAPDPDELVTFHIQGVTPGELRDLAALGYGITPADDLVKLHIHGIRPAFIRELQGLGYPRLGVDPLISLHLHGVTPEFVRRVQARGEGRPSVERLIDLKIRGFGD